MELYLPQFDFQGASGFSGSGLELKAKVEGPAMMS